MKIVKEDEQVLFEDERENFKFRCRPEGYDFGFAGSSWIRNCSWKVGVDKREIFLSSLRLDEISLGSGVDKSGSYQWMRQKWSGELRVEVEFKFYGEGVILAIFRFLNPPNRPLNIDFPLFPENSVNEGLYVAVIQSSDETGVWPIIRIEKPKNAFKRLLEANEDSTEYLPFWVYDERKTIVILPADNFIDTRFVCKKRENTRELSCELSGIPNGSVEHKVIIFYSSEGPSEALVEAGSFLRRLHHRRILGVAAECHSYLGYSTANGSFYFNFLNEKVLPEVLNDLQAKEIPAKWLQIDVMWYKSSKRWPSSEELSKFAEKLKKGSGQEILDFINSIWGVVEFEPNEKDFPYGFERVKGRAPIGLWIWTTYFDENTPYRKKYSWNEKDNIPVEKEFWLNRAKQFKDWRTIWVEPDNLVHVNRFRSLNHIGEKEKWLVEAIESFGEYNIPVQMCMCPSKLYPVALKTKNAHLIRTSNDFRMRPDLYEIYQNFYNSSLAWAFGLYPCFDVYFTGKESYEKVKNYDRLNSPLEYYHDADIIPEFVAHALSCGVNYIGDGIGMANAGLIKKICTQEGKLIHPDKPAIPTRRCFLEDPLEKKSPLVVYTCLGEYVLVGVFNLDDLKKEHRVPLEEVGLASGSRCCDLKLFKKETDEVQEMISGDLDARGCELHIVSPWYNLHYR
ncbi:MAG: Sip1-related alpha-galactosidase [bacterium]